MIQLRALERRNMQGTPEYKQAKERVDKIQSELNQHRSVLGQKARETEEVKNSMADTNRKLLFGAGMPGLAGLAYGHSAMTEQ